MSWRDRDYNRGYGEGGIGSPLLGILFGSVPLGTYFGIRVRVHASLIILVITTLLLDYTHGYVLQSRIVSMAALFVIILLHEFGHCFAARSVGGDARDILMWPLGGLASATPPHRPWPTFVTVAGGPLVNVIICLVAGIWLFTATGGLVPLDPFHPLPPVQFARLTQVTFYVWWVFDMSYYLLLFNLMPIYPLDGGQLLQAMLWPRIGYYRSMNFSCVAGMVGAVGAGLFGIIRGSLFLVFLAVFGFLECHRRRLELKEMGPEGWQDAFDYSASLHEPHRPRHLSRRAIRRAQRLAAQEQAEQGRIDAILEKVSARGMPSLNWWERRALRKATERQRQRDLELSRSSRDA
jgi:Zn-dependent protease